LCEGAFKRFCGFVCNSHFSSSFSFVMQQGSKTLPTVPSIGEVKKNSHVYRLLWRVYGQF